MIYLACILSFFSGAVVTGLILGLVRAASERDANEVASYDALRPPAWCSPQSPVSIAVSHEELLEQRPVVEMWDDDSRDARIYRFELRRRRA